MMEKRFGIHASKTSFLCLLCIVSIIFWMILKTARNDTELVTTTLSAEVLRSLNCPEPQAGDQVSFAIADVMSGRAILKQHEPKLIEIIRTKYLKPPSLKPYQLLTGKDNPSQVGQPTEILKILGRIRDGFFIESGAFDGEVYSNSLVLEKTLGWRGLLVEGDPKNYDLLLQKNRKAWSVMFKQSGTVGQIKGDVDDSAANKDGVVEVQCLPIYSILLALNVTTVHYFSLDVEGVELEVLKTIPWDKVDIQTLSVENLHGAWSKADLKSFMEQQGYWTYNDVAKFTAAAYDFIFVKDTFKTKEDYLSQIA
ncbi:uncharacterized protein LOC108675939 isoform X2 [Hyalella azteca]|uniref:Uncharacterized protein LOC108675939 isoform X2 n=1 Tax=Hyalella azteca TaxID=294128 RepID=A0A8B7P0E5_HYAAZ|nr:uncharacterized protein LOC108675939 isoform X2 [Hyalella azteca]